MSVDAIERSIRLVENGRISTEPLSSEEADAILGSRIALEDLLRDEPVKEAALRLFAEVGLAKLGAQLASTASTPIGALLARLRREQRDAALDRVAPEPIELWSAALVRRGIQILGRELLSEAATDCYLEALRAGLPSADAISQRFGELIDGKDAVRAKHEGIEVATSGRATSKKLAFLKARVADGTMDPARFSAWTREHYLIAMYGRSVRTGLAVALAAHVDVDSVSAEDMARGRARDLLIEPETIEIEDLPIIEEALDLGIVSKVERDEALRKAMFHRFEQGAAGDRTALALELALGFDEWTHPGLLQARRRGVELELRLLREGRKITQEQTEYLEASVVRGILAREELDSVRTATYLELRWGANPRADLAESLKSFSSDAAWLERLPEKKPCWVGEIDLAARLRKELGSQSTTFARIAEGIIDWLPLFSEPAQARASFESLLTALEDAKADRVERLRSFPPEVLRVALARARPIIESIAPKRPELGWIGRRRPLARATSSPSPARRVRVSPPARAASRGS